MFSIIFLFTIIVFLIFILLKLINFRKNYIIFFLITLFIIIFIINIETSLDAVVDGLSLCLNSIIPTMFPFSVICNLLIYYDGIAIYSKFLGPIFCKPLGLTKTCSFPIAASLICGYPLGAKYCSDIYELGYINKNEYIRLLNIASNCGPIFILGVIGGSLLNNIKIGYLLLIANYLSIFIIGLLTRNNSIKSPSRAIQIKKSPDSFGDNLKKSVENAISTTLLVTGFIVIFTIIISIIKENNTISIILFNIENFLYIPNGALSSLFLGCIEITNGCKLITTYTFSIPLKLGLISFLCSFSGLSIIAQASAFISGHSVSLKKYTFFKLIQGIISFIITYSVAYFYRGSIEAFSSNLKVDTSPNIALFFLPGIIMLFVYFFMYIFKKLFFHTS